MGVAPKGFKNHTYPLKTPHTYEPDPEVIDIPQPTSPPPRFFKLQQAQTTYEAAPEVSKINLPTSSTTTTFIPSTVRNKVNQSQRKELNNVSDQDNEDDMAEYASEEEEAMLNLKRKADHLE